MYYSEPPHIFFIKCPKETILPVFKIKAKYLGGKNLEEGIEFNSTVVALKVYENFKRM